jgi:hypothetical protein
MGMGNMGRAHVFTVLVFTTPTATMTIGYFSAPRTLRTNALWQTLELFDTVRRSPHAGEALSKHKFACAGARPTV